MAVRVAAKILVFLVIGAGLFSLLPELLWHPVSGPWYIRGPVRGSFVSVLLLLALTYLFAKTDGWSLADVGIAASPRFFRCLGFGVVAGVTINAASAELLAFVFHFQWRLNPHAIASSILAGLLLNVCSAAAEELIYRGYALKRGADLLGAWTMVAILTAIFVGFHWFAWGAWGHPDRMLSVACTVGLAGVFFSVSYLRSQTLALPIGLHLGFIWSNADIFTGMFARWYDDPNGLLIATGTERFLEASRHGWLLVNLPNLTVLVLSIGLLMMGMRGRVGTLRRRSA